MKNLRIDLETYSTVDLRNGVHKYIESDDFDILLFAYAVNDGDVHVIDLASGEGIPKIIIDSLSDSNVIKLSFNAQFERLCLSRYLFNKYRYKSEVWSVNKLLDPTQWRCTMVHALELGLPGSLRKCAEFLRLDERKNKAGENLINYFSKPCAATKSNGFRSRNLPEHNLEKWEQFKEYCIQDVIVEQAIANRLSFSPVSESEWLLYALDQKINDYGVLIDSEFVSKVDATIKDIDSENLTKIKHLTHLENPKSPKQLKEWLSRKGYNLPNLTKDTVDKLLNQEELEPKVGEVLMLRKALSNTSNKKYQTMINTKGSDNRLRGLVQFYGASRTGRWAGRLIQVQNLPRNKIENLDEARNLVLANRIESLEETFGNASEVIKQLIRTALIAKEGYTFLVSDFNAIEARVLAWYANENWVLDIFRDHGKIYEATASKMFGIPIGKINSDLRQKGKVATLALGYQGSVGALTKMGALTMGLKEDELKPLVTTWRNANSNIVNFWRDVQDAVIKAINTKERVIVNKKLEFSHRKGVLFIKLPSGRKLAYPRAKIEQGLYGPKIIFQGRDQTTNFSKQDTYGGKLVENIVQATARDLLGEAMLRLDKEGYNIVFHVHDEVVVEASTGEKTVDEMNKLMSIVPDWAKGLPLSAEGYQTDYYKKE